MEVMKGRAWTNNWKKEEKGTTLKTVEKFWEGVEGDAKGGGGMKRKGGSIITTPPALHSAMRLFPPSQLQSGQIIYQFRPKLSQARPRRVSAPPKLSTVVSTTTSPTNVTALAVSHRRWSRSPPQCVSEPSVWTQQRRARGHGGEARGGWSLDCTHIISLSG